MLKKLFRVSQGQMCVSICPLFCCTPIQLTCPATPSTFFSSHYIKKKRKSLHSHIWFLAPRISEVKNCSGEGKREKQTSNTVTGFLRWQNGIKIFWKWFGIWKGQKWLSGRQKKETFGKTWLTVRARLETDTDTIRKDLLLLLNRSSQPADRDDFHTYLVFCCLTLSVSFHYQWLKHKHFNRSALDHLL